MSTKQKCRISRHILDAGCCYKEGSFRLSFLPCKLPEFFTARFTPSVDFTAGDAITIKGRKFTIKTRTMEEPLGKLFSAGAVVQCDIDMEQELAFITPGGEAQASGVNLGSALPKMNGTASAGSSTSVSREDHVHPRGFTAAEEAALASGITQPLREKLEGLPGKEYMMAPKLPGTVVFADNNAITPFSAFAPVNVTANTWVYGSAWTAKKSGFVRITSTAAHSGMVRTRILLNSATINGQHTVAFFSSPPSTAQTTLLDSSFIPVSAGDTLTCAIFSTVTEKLSYSGLCWFIFYDVKAVEPPILNYSLDEQATGRKWIDGKEIYQKTLLLDSLPNSATKSWSLGFTTLDTLVSVECVILDRVEGSQLQLGIGNTADNHRSIDCFVRMNNYTGTNGAANSFCINTGVDRTSFTGTATLRYTRTDE